MPSFSCPAFESNVGTPCRNHRVCASRGLVPVAHPHQPHDVVARPTAPTETAGLVLSRGLHLLAVEERRLWRQGPVKGQPAPLKPAGCLRGHIENPPAHAALSSFTRRTSQNRPCFSPATVATPVSLR